ncbi:MAG: sporulation protein [Clostridia bacterium]
MPKQFRLPKSTFVLLTAVLALTVLGGCNQYRAQGDRSTTYGVNRETLMGRNQNPNILVGPHAVRNYSVDQNQLQMAAKSVPGVENARISISGGNAYVTLDMLPNVTAEQARNIEQQVIAALVRKAPRYDYHMTSNDGVHR